MDRHIRRRAVRHLEKGRVVIVPGNALGYVELGGEKARSVGFAAL